MSARPIIRAGSVEDVPALIVIELAAGELFAGTHMGWAVGQAPSPDQFEGALDRNELWVLEHGGTVVGFLIGDQRDGDFFIAQVSVAPSHHRRGLGRMLIEAVLQAARGRGFAAASLTTDRTIPWNAPYYERLGFRILAPDVMPPQLAEQLASEPHSGDRCAMRLVL